MLNQFLGEEGTRRISKWAATSLLLLSVFLLVKIITDLKRLPTVGDEIYPQSTIMASGEGEAFAIPDIATFSFTVTESGKTVQAAQDKLNNKINAALAAVRELGIEEKDIKTTNYNVYPKYEWNQRPCPLSAVGAGAETSYYPCPSGKNELVGYEVSQTILIKSRDTAKAPDLVTKVGETGVSNISGVEFTVDDREKYVAEAREQAIKKAKENAKKLAKELGVKLGRMLYYNEGGYPTPFAEGMGGDMRVTALPTKAELPEGETKIVLQVSITYEIK